jgi:hypothetical protein
MFNCARVECHRQVLVCRRCDRGQRYCGRECAELQRRVQVRLAGRAFQFTQRGARLHAARSQRWRDRRKFSAQIVTQHASTLELACANNSAQEAIDDARLETSPAGEPRPCTAPGDERDGRHSQGSAAAVAPTPPCAADAARGLSLWSGEPLEVAVSAAESSDWVGSGLFGDDFIPAESQLVQFHTGRLGYRVRRLRGVADFRSLRRGAP